MAYRCVNSLGVPWYLHGREVRATNASLWVHWFSREVRPALGGTGYRLHRADRPLS